MGSNRRGPLIGQLVLSLTPGGLERMVLDLVAGLAAEGFPCVVYCLEEEGPWASQLQQSGTPVRLVKKKPGIDWSLPFRLLRSFRADGVSLIHSHNKGPLFYACLASAISGLPLVTTKHGRNEPDKWQYLWSNRLSGVLGRAVVAVSRDALKVATEIERVPARKVSFIPNGVRTDHPPASAERLAALRGELGIAVGDLVVISVARLSEEKNHALMLEAFSLLAREDPAARLLLVGDGPLRGDLEAKTTALGLSERVIFAGMREEVPELLQLGHVFALSSVTEGLSISIMEAMSAGLPVVATDVGGNRELVTAGSTGLLVPPQGAEEFKEALARVLGDSRLRQEMGREARRRILGEYSVQVMVSRYAELYRRLLA